MFETDVIRNLVDFSSLLSEKCADSSKKWALIEPTAKKLILIISIKINSHFLAGEKKKKKSDENQNLKKLFETWLSLSAIVKSRTIFFCFGDFHLR